MRIYMGYELAAYLRHLTLCGQDDDGDLEWIGTQKQWASAQSEITNYETFTD